MRLRLVGVVITGTIAGLVAAAFVLFAAPAAHDGAFVVGAIAGWLIVIGALVRSFGWERVRTRRSERSTGLAFLLVVGAIAAAVAIRNAMPDAWPYAAIGVVFPLLVIGALVLEFGLFRADPVA
jgi:hypothetical protein